jgi:chromosome segregation ATPase
VVKGVDEGGSSLSEEPAGGGLRARGEEALGDLAQALLENPLFNQALTAALGAGERAAQAQRTAMGALNIPAASELERLEQRLRSLSNRLESVEDRLDDARDEVAALRRRLSSPEPAPGPADEEVSLPDPRER